MSGAGHIRQRIWERLKDVARPDARLHMDFSEFIPDFEGAELATDRLLAWDKFSRDALVFVTPDNSLTTLRRELIVQGIPFIMSTYNMRRGFLYMAPGRVPRHVAQCAAWLEGMEYFAQPISLAGIAELGRFSLAVTGASAVSMEGLRFGKGHVYFDLEWGLFTDLGLMDEATPVAALVHDVQVVEDKMFPSETDIAVDAVSTPSRFLPVERATRRPRGIRWDRLSRDQIVTIPPLLELASMRGIVSGEPR